MRKTTTILLGLAILALAGTGTAHADDSNAISGPISCWSCNTMLYGFLILQALHDAPSNLASMIWPIFGVIFAISAAWTVAQGFAAGINPLRPIYSSLPIFGLVSVLFITPGLLSTVTWDMTVLPVIEAGATIGTALANATNSAVNSQVPMTACIANDPASAGITDASLLRTAAMVRDNTCQVHQAVATMFRIGSIMSSQQLPTATIADKATAQLFVSIGSMIMFSSYVALVSYALTLLETLIRLGLYATFSPFVVMFTVFRSTRGSLIRAISIMLNLFLSLTANGIIASTTMFLLLMAMTLGVDVTATAPMAPADLINKLNNAIVAGNTITDYHNLGAVLRMAAMTIIGSSMAMSIASATQDLITEITQVEVDGSGNHAMANAVTRSLSSVATLAQGVGAAALTGIGGRLGQTIGGLTRFR